MQDENHVARTLGIYHRLLDLSPGGPSLRLWDGSFHGPGDAAATLVLRHPGALRALLVPGNELTAGESYVYDDIDIEGDIVEALRWAAGLEGLPSDAVSRIASQALRLPRDARRRYHDRPARRGRLHSPARDRRAVRHHYDTGNDFFSTFLGSTMVYSCAVFLDPDEPLDVAQTRKLDLICRKLALSPGQRLLDVGCGWGSMVIHAARGYGVQAVGITLSEEQATAARDRVAAAGLADQVEIRVQDYRDVQGEFDAISSIGMVEHVGRSNLDEYFRAMRSALAPGGIFLNHGIADRSDTPPSKRRKGFVGTYVFPDGDLLGVGHMIDSAERNGWEVRDVEALRVDYALTLRRWIAELERNRDHAVAAAGERVYRIWRLYMAGSALAFERGAIGVHQLLLTDPARRWSHGRASLLARDDRLHEMDLALDIRDLERSRLDD